MDKIIVLHILKKTASWDVTTCISAEFSDFWRSCVHLQASQPGPKKSQARTNQGVTEE
jgi:hypothetical protein